MGTEPNIPPVSYGCVPFKTLPIMRLSDGRSDPLQTQAKLEPSAASSALNGAFVAACLSTAVKNSRQPPQRSSTNQLMAVGTSAEGVQCEH